MGKKTRRKPKKNSKVKLFILIVAVVLLGSIYLNTKTNTLHSQIRIQNVNACEYGCNDMASLTYEDDALIKACESRCMQRFYNGITSYN